MQRVLIIEDTDDMRKMINMFVSRMGFEVYEATNGLEGIRMAGTVHPDVIILDLMMPVAEGDLALGYMRSTPELRHTPVIVTSAHPKAPEIAQALGANACLLKPFDFNELRKLIEEMAAVSAADEGL